MWSQFKQNGKAVPAEAIEVIGAQPETDFLTPVDVDPKDAHGADPHFAFWGHFAKQTHWPAVLSHDAHNARVSCQPVQKLESLLRGWGQTPPLPSLKPLERVGPCTNTCKVESQEYRL